ncbi:MAG: flagellar basal body P-ring formation chaperone FlgA [Oceanidesulfovibrio sp.]
MPSTMQRIRVAAMLATVLTLCAAACAYAAVKPGETPWRIAIREAAVVAGDTVTLGEIAQPMGPAPQDHWEKLAATRLWPSPEADGGPMAVNRDKLQQALDHYLGGTAQLCLLPDRLVLRRGGTLLSQDQLAAIVVKTLTPKARALGGDFAFRDYRIPESHFLKDSTNTLDIALDDERIEPGRVTFKFVETDLRGETVQRISASVFLDCFRDVMVAAATIDRDEPLTPDKVTMRRMNAAYLKSEPWDGRGGPWRVTRPVGENQPLYKDEIEALPLVRKGEAVELVFEGAFVKLKVLAEALEDAGPGEAVRVRNMQSQREVYAKVRDAHTVVVR